MLLSRIEIDDFRGIEHLELDADETTILIGENAVGKSSILDALDLCLGHGTSDSFLFAPHDFRLDGDGAPCGPIRIALTFEERRDGEWQPLHGLYSAFVKGSPRRVLLRIEATAGDAGTDVACTFVDGSGARLEPQPGPEALAELRRLNPVLLVRTDHFFGERRRAAAPDETGEPFADEAPRELEREIERVSQEIMRSDGPIAPETLKRGLGAIARLIGRHGDRLFRHPEKPQLLLEDLVQHPVALAIDAGPRLEARLHGSGAQSVALLVMLGALLEARGLDALSDDAEPILAIEEPEAHLHPLMLAAVWGVIDGLRGQKVITTNASDLLAAARLSHLRRLVRRPGRTVSYRLGGRTLSLEEVRKVSYHIRLKRDDALFSRCWLLVEGETEFWLFPELARLLGIDFATEGIHCVEFAQAGVEPLVKLANDLGIEWHLVADGDLAGHSFAAIAAAHLKGAPRAERITLLSQRDLEHCLWDSGYAYVYHSYARGRSTVTRTSGKKSRKNPGRVIGQAIDNTSKPFLALAVVEQAGEEGSPGVPEVLRHTVRAALRLARSAAPAPAIPSRTSGDRA